MIIVGFVMLRCEIKFIVLIFLLCIMFIDLMLCRLRLFIGLCMFGINQIGWVYILGMVVCIIFVVKLCRLVGVIRCGILCRLMLEVIMLDVSIKLIWFILKLVFCSVVLMVFCMLCCSVVWLLVMVVLCMLIWCVVWQSVMLLCQIVMCVLVVLVLMVRMFMCGIVWCDVGWSLGLKFFYDLW